MDTKLNAPTLVPQHVPEYGVRPPQLQPGRAASKEEQLPFTVRLVHGQEDLGKALQIRHAAYARHVPSFADTLRTAEAADNADGVAILLAESKLDGAPLGTMRIQTNRYSPLSLEQSVELPAWLQNKSLAEATRLGVTEQKIGRNVKTVLFKAYFLYCVQNGIDWMVITARTPIDRQYDRLLFSDVYPGTGLHPHAPCTQHAAPYPLIRSRHRRRALEPGAASPDRLYFPYPSPGHRCGHENAGPTAVMQGGIPVVAFSTHL